MNKVWQGRSSGVIDKDAELLNRSITFDRRLYYYDIKGSIAHVRMLSYCCVITKEEEEILVSALSTLLDDIKNGRTHISLDAEDIHSFVEDEITKRVGDVGKKIHTARSRNDQVALDLRLYLKDVCKVAVQRIDTLLCTLVDMAEKNIDTVMPGFTHLQHAQPILFSHWILSYASMLLRDRKHFEFAYYQTDESPIGSCALAGTGINIDRFYEARLLGFGKVSANSIDGVSNRDFAADFLYSSSLLIMHLSRFCEELVIFSSTQYSFVDFSDDYSTGSSIMPQKKNPDMAELIRGKTGRVYGNLVSLLTTLKGLPLAYNKDMQEDKEAVFDTVDTILRVLNVLNGMIGTLKINGDNMRSSAERGYINATDFADYLVLKGVPFRDAYKISGKVVHYAIEEKKSLSEITLPEFKRFSSLIENDIYDSININSCVNKRKSYGGTSRECVLEQIDRLKEALKKKEA